VGSGLEVEQELIQLTAFAAEGSADDAGVPPSRIARPTRRLR